MKIFGFQVPQLKWGSALVPVRSNRNTLLGFVQESFAGAWQKNVVVDNDSQLLAFSAVYACVTRIANDISKLRPKLVERTEEGIWVEVARQSPFLPVLRRPNHYQNRIQFFAQWVISKLLHGNAYILKERDQRGIVVAMYLLDPRLVIPMVAQSGDVFYQINVDRLSGVENTTTVPASEVIHDRMPGMWHPLVGTSPIHACGSSATQGIRIQANSAQFFENMSRPSGMLTAPGHIPDDTAERLKKAFEDNFKAQNIGRLAVLGDGLAYEAMTIPATDAQLIEQLRWTVEDVARCFHVPLHMINSAGAGPTFSNIASLNQSYYTQTLQTLIEAMELCLDDGLGLDGVSIGTELDTDMLLRMDTPSRYQSYTAGIGAGWMAPNEARRKENMPGAVGGEKPMMQQQNWPLDVLSKRPPPTDVGGGSPVPQLGGPGQPPPVAEALSEEEEAVAAELRTATELASALITKFTEAEAYAETL